MAFFPWTRLKQLLKEPWMYYTAGFGLQYLCNDISAAVQKQGYGLITFVPYMAVFSILAVDFVFSWVKHVRRQETLPRHNQDIQMNATRQAEDMQMDQTYRSSLSRQKTFNRRTWVGNEEVEDAASGNKRQAGETGESQCLSGEAKDEVAEVEKPQQSVSTTKNKCTEARVWKSPELRKQDVTSSLANGSIVNKGGSTNSGTVAARGNPRRAHTESTSKKDDVKDEVMESIIPLQNRFSSKNKESIGSRGCSINNGTGVATTGNRRAAHTGSTSQNDDAKDQVMESKNPQQHRCPSKNKQSIVSRGGADNSGKGVATTGNRRSADTKSTSQNDDSKDEVMEAKNPQQHTCHSKNKQSIVSRGGADNSGKGVATTGNRRSADTESTSQNDDSKDEVMEAKNPQQHTCHSKNKQSIVSRVGYINSRRRVATTGNWRNANTGSTSKKDDAEGRIEWKNLQQSRSPSKNKCVPPAHELLKLQEPTLTSRFGMGTGSGMSGKGLEAGNT